MGGRAQRRWRGDVPLFSFVSGWCVAVSGLRFPQVVSSPGAFVLSLETVSGEVGLQHPGREPVRVSSPLLGRSGRRDQP